MDLRILLAMSESEDNVGGLPPAAVEVKEHCFGERWSEEVLEPGFTVIPSVILRAQARLGINAIELAVLLHLIDHWWEDDTKPLPSKKRLAARLGVSDKTVQRAAKRLDEGGLIRREKRSRGSGSATSNCYDLSPLVEKLKSIATDMAKAPDQAVATCRTPLRRDSKRRPRGDIKS